MRLPNDENFVEKASSHTAAGTVAKPGPHLSTAILQTLGTHSAAYTLVLPALTTTCLNTALRSSAHCTSPCAALLTVHRPAQLCTLCAALRSLGHCARPCAATSNVFTDIGSWWEDVRPGWIFPKDKRVERAPPAALSQQPSLSLTSISAVGKPPTLVPATNLKLPGSMGRGS